MNFILHSIYFIMYTLLKNLTNLSLYTKIIVFKIKATIKISIETDKINNKIWIPKICLTNNSLE